MLIRILATASILWNLFLNDKRLHEKPRSKKALPLWVQRFLIPLAAIPALAMIVAGSLEVAGFGDLGERFWRGCVVIGLPAALFFYILDYQRAAFASIYGFTALIFTAFSVFIVFLIVIPSIYWWWSGEFFVHHLKEKGQFSILTSVILSPFFTMYALFAADDSQVEQELNREWMKEVFLKLLIKPLTVILTVLSILIGIIQLLFKVSMTSDQIISRLWL